MHTSRFPDHIVKDVQECAGDVDADSPLHVTAWGASHARQHGRFATLKQMQREDAAREQRAILNHAERRAPRPERAGPTPKPFDPAVRAAALAAAQPVPEFSILRTYSAQPRLIGMVPEPVPRRAAGPDPAPRIKVHVASKEAIAAARMACAADADAARIDPCRAAELKPAALGAAEHALMARVHIEAVETARRRAFVADLIREIERELQGAGESDLTWREWHRLRRWLENR